MTTGYLSVLLHAHLPFVRHPEYPEFLEEDWLYEAITETYVPLVRMMEALQHDGVHFRLTMSLTPPLCEMLADTLLQDRYVRHLEKILELAEAQAVARRGTPFAEAAQQAADELRTTRTLFCERWGRQLLPRFRELQDAGVLEIITCAATHAFLPLMATDLARRAQLEIAVNNYRKHFGRDPRGIWLPECAYAAGLEALLAEVGIRWFVLEEHGVSGASPTPRFGPYRPIVTPAGVAAFGRDPETSRQVWSADSGYPGDPLYREFYRDLGYDLELDEVRPYLHSDGIRRNIGLKLHRITGKVDLAKKEPYVPSWARERAAHHAGNFLFNRQAQARHLHGVLGTAPHIMAPYDAELFGHWWFEGPIFLEMLFRKMHFDQDEIEPVTPSEYLEREPIHQLASPAMSSWGAGGYYEVWLNGGNDWMLRHLHRAEERMIELAARFAAPDELQRRALNQAARELLLAQSSDWAFIVTTNTMVEYAEKRTRDHVARFNGLYLQLTEDRLEESWLAELESRDSIFQELDYRVFSPGRHGLAAADASRGACVTVRP